MMNGEGGIGGVRDGRRGTLSLSDGILRKGDLALSSVNKRDTRRGQVRPPTECF